MASALDHPEVAGLLAAASYADVGVDTTTGPHVTPAAFAAASNRIWLVSSRRTVRVRAVRRTGHAAVLVRDGDRALLVSGRAQVLSLWNAREVRALLAGTGPATRAAATYALRNARSVLSGFVADVLSGAGDLTVQDRVLIAVDADRGVVLDGARLAHSWGRWRRRATAALRSKQATTATPSLRVLLGGVPPAVVRSLHRDAGVSLGWSTPQGCVVLPATCADVDRERLHVSAALLAAVGARSGATACATVHRSQGRRPSGFRGVVARGTARVVARGAARATISLRADRMSWWSGYESGTARAA